MDYLEVDKFGRTFPRKVHRTPREAIRKPMRKVSLTPRYCVVCGQKLSLYNKSKTCWGKNCDK